MHEQRQKIFIVDDDPINIKVLSELLNEKYSILVSTNGWDALQFIENSDPPDLILLDIIMPGIDGYEVCKRLKAHEKLCYTPIIFITTQSAEQDEVKGFDVGAVDFITKPFSGPVVRSRVKTHLELKELRDILHRISLRDGLTGISNRLNFNNSLSLEWKRMQREQQPLSLIMCDIDYFKNYNDLYGHQAGDQCLQAVASIIDKNAKRPGDLASRYGGEEFAVILPNTELKGAVYVAEKIRSDMQNHKIPHDASVVSLFVSLSIGVASILPVKEVEPSKLITLADAALYKAKRNGRNRVEQASNVLDYRLHNRCK